MPHARGGGQSAAGADRLAVFARLRAAINMNDLTVPHRPVSLRIIRRGPIQVVLGRAIQELEVSLVGADDLRRLIKAGSRIVAGQKLVVGSGSGFSRGPMSGPLITEPSRTSTLMISGAAIVISCTATGAAFRCRDCAPAAASGQRKSRFPTPIQSVTEPAIRLARTERLDSFIAMDSDLTNASVVGARVSKNRRSVESASTTSPKLEPSG